MPSIRPILFLLASLFCLSGVVTAQTATPVSTCPESQFSRGTAIGIVTPGSANNLRAQPSANGELLGRVLPQKAFEVITSQAAVCAGGYLWREIQTPTLRGWTVERAADGGEPFIVPFSVPEPREVGVMAEDGSITVEATGVSFTIPAGLGITTVTVAPQIGGFGQVMSAQPSSVLFEFFDSDAKLKGSIKLLPYDGYDDGYAPYEELDALLADKPALIDYTRSNPIPQEPIGGTAALFGGAGVYLPFGSGDGLRYLTYFAQDSVIFTTDTSFSYQYRGITSDGAFFVVGHDFWTQPPDAAIPAAVSPYDSAYFLYLRQLETNLVTQPVNAFSPDLTLFDAIFTSLTISDNDVLYAAIP